MLAHIAPKYLVRSMDLTLERIYQSVKEDCNCIQAVIQVASLNAVIG